MAEIIYEAVGKNYQVPGLPYEETFANVKSVVLDDVPSQEQIVDILKQADEEILINPWSLYVVNGFRDYIPTTFKRITHNMGSAGLEDLFGVDTDWIPESDRLLLQLQTEIEAKAATIDAGIIHGRRELGTVINKAHVTNRLYNIGRIYGHLSERDSPFLFGITEDESTWDAALSDIKTQFIEYMKEIPVGPRKYPLKTLKAEVGKKQLKTDYPYIDWLKEKLGDNFLGALLYGSAARTNDPSKYGDYDNWVLVDDMGKAHEALKGTSPAVIIAEDGTRSVVEGCHEDGPSIKHLGIHLFPNDETYIVNHIRFLHDSKEFRKHTRVLYGEFPFPKVRMDEIVERGVSHAYVKLKTIAGSLNWAYSAPEKIQGKPALFEFVVKNLRFFMQHSLNAMGEPTFRDKHTLNDLLAERDLFLPKYKPDFEHIRNSLVYSMQAVFQLQKELIESGRKPNLAFLNSDVEEPITRDIDWDSMGELR